MTADDVVKLLSALPKEQRYRAGKVIEQAEKRGWANIRFFDRIGRYRPDEKDLIGTRPSTGETEFLHEYVLE